MSDGSELYRILGIPPDSSETAVKRAFNKKCKELHPDKHPDKADEFCELSSAFNKWKEANKKKPPSPDALKRNEELKQKLRKELEEKKRKEEEEEKQREKEFLLKKQREEEKKIREEIERKKREEEEQRRKAEEEEAERKIKELEEEALRRKQERERQKKEESKRRKEEAQRRKLEEEELLKKAEEEKKAKLEEMERKERAKEREEARKRIKAERAAAMEKKRIESELPKKIETDLRDIEEPKELPAERMTSRAKTPKPIITSEPSFEAAKIKTSRSKPDIVSTVKKTVRISLQEAINGAEKVVDFDVSVFGKTVNNRTSIKIPAGVSNGFVITEKGKGNVDENGRQDATFEINYDLNGYVIEGPIIKKVIYVPIKDAIENKKIKIDFPNGGKSKKVSIDKLIEEGSQSMTFDGKGLLIGSSYGKFVAEIQLEPVVKFKPLKSETIVKFTPPAEEFFEKSLGNCNVEMPKGTFDGNIEIYDDLRICGSKTSIQSIIVKSRFLEINDLIITDQLESEFSIIYAKNCTFKGKINLSSKAGIIAENCAFESQIDIETAGRYSSRGSFINCKFECGVICYGNSIVNFEECSFSKTSNAIVLTEDAVALVNNTNFIDCEQPINVSGNSLLYMNGVYITSDAETIGIAMNDKAKIIGLITLENSRVAMTGETKLTINSKSKIQTQTKPCITSKANCSITLLPGADISTGGTTSLNVSGGNLIIEMATFSSGIKASNTNVTLKGGRFKGNASFKSCEGTVSSATFMGTLSLTGDCSPVISDSNAASACFKVDNVNITGTTFTETVYAISGSCRLEKCKFSCAHETSGTAVIVSGASVLMSNPVISFAAVGIDINEGNATVEGTETQFVRVEKPFLVRDSGNLRINSGFIIDGCSTVVGGNAVIKATEFDGEGPFIVVDGGAITVHSCTFDAEPSIILNDGKLTAKHQRSGKVQVNGGEYIGSGNFIMEV